MRRACTNVLIFFVVLACVLPFISRADVNPQSCDQLFQMAPGTIEMSADKKIMNPEVCDAYQFLISRYDIGDRSAPCINNKAQGILGLNPDFAVALARMLKKAPYMRINSALRPPTCQGSKNPQSNHIYGCAVDLGYSKSDCNSQQCQWVLHYAPADGLQIRMKYDPEWNHVEPTNVQQCRAKSPGGGVVPTSRMPFDGNIRSIIGFPAAGGIPGQSAYNQSSDQNGQNCSLPDGSVVPCSAIKNGTAPVGSAGQGGAPGGGAAPAQALPAQQQPLQNLPSPTPVSNLITPSGSINVPSNGNPTATSSASKTPISAIDQISAIGNPAQASVAATSAPLLLVVSGQDSAALQQNPPPQSANPSPAGSSYYYGAPPTQQTFASNDLSAGIPPSFSPEPTNQLQSILLDFRNLLLQILQYLKPFGGTVPGTVPPGTSASEAD